MTSERRRAALISAETVSASSARCPGCTVSPRPSGRGLCRMSLRSVQERQKGSRDGCAHKVHVLPTHAGLRQESSARSCQKLAEIKEIATEHDIVGIDEGARLLRPCVPTVFVNAGLRGFFVPYPSHTFLVCRPILSGHCVLLRGNGQRGQDRVCVRVGRHLRAKGECCRADL